MAKTIRVTDEIAFQDSLLALNAAVEAAHAGGAAEGFEEQSHLPLADARGSDRSRDREGAVDSYTAQKLNAQSTDLRNMAVRLDALAGAPVRTPAKGA